MACLDFITRVHKPTRRNYLERVVEHDKAASAEKAKEWGYDYWDGDRRYGFGGYHYDGRWRPVADEMARHYGLRAGDRVLDVGCGKAFLLYEFTRAVPGIEVCGLDISAYAIAHAKEEVKPYLEVGDAARLPFSEASFDLVYSVNTLHNLYAYQLMDALEEIRRVGRRHRYVCVESYRNEREKVNLLYWQLTCECFCTPAEWEWWFERAGYEGDWGFVFFE